MKGAVFIGFNAARSNVMPGCVLDRRLTQPDTSLWGEPKDYES
ncbi:hypothetical protein ABIC03_007818 [Bradyrhizobium sp. RT6a]